MELASYTATVAMDSTSWGLTLRNVSCLPHDVRRAWAKTWEDERFVQVGDKGFDWSGRNEDNISFT